MNVQGAPLRKNDGALNDVLEFAHIPWPGVTTDDSHGFVSDCATRFSKLRTKLVEQTLNERDQVVWPLLRTRSASVERPETAAADGSAPARSSAPGRSRNSRPR